MLLFSFLTSLAFLPPFVEYTKAGIEYRRLSVHMRPKHINRALGGPRDELRLAMGGPILFKV